MNAEASRQIERHNLHPLPQEGGYFRRTWTSPEADPGSPNRPNGTAILYLMTPESFSALHQLDADELWSFQAGDPVEHFRLDPRTGTVRLTLLGPDTLAGHQPRVVVPAGVWQAARPALRGGQGWSLVAATSTPGWDESGFVLGDGTALQAKFPDAAGLIAQFVR